MAPGYGISSIGSYANDPYFMYALNSYNPNFMGTQQTAQTTPQYSAVDTTSTVTTPSVSADPTFKGSSKNDDDGISTGKLVAGGLLVAGSALACLKAYKKGDGTGLKKMFNGFKQYGQKILGTSAKEVAEKAADKADDAAAKISNIIKNGGKNLQECNIKNGADNIVLKGGQIESIVQTTENKIKNISGISLPKGIKVNSKGVNLSGIERTINLNGKNYKVVLDTNGNVISAFAGKNKINPDDVSGLVEKAQTYTHQLKGIKLTLPDSHGVPTDYTRNYHISVRNGNVVDATYVLNGQTKHLTEEQCKLLQETIPGEIAKFGRAKNGYGLNPQECIYEYADKNRRYLFNGNSRKVTEAYDIKSKTLRKPKDVEDYITKHGLQDIITTGNLPSNMEITSAIYESGAGNIYTIGKNGKIEKIKLKNACTVTTGKGKKTKTHNYQAGAEITTANNQIDIWRNGVYGNNSDYEEVSKLLQ